MTLRKYLYTIAIFCLVLFAACDSSQNKNSASSDASAKITGIAPTEAIPTIVPTEAPVAEPLPVPVFSHRAGFYDDYFLLTLSSEAGTEIYYTIDGTDPRTSKTAYRYTQEIEIYNNTDEPNRYSTVKDISLSNYNPPKYNIDKGMHIRAAVKNADETFGPVVTNSYFVGKTDSYYTDLRVISMVTDPNYLFHKDTGAYMVGSRYYEWKKSSDYVKYDPADVQNKTNYNFDGKESEFPVTIQVFENGTAVFTADVGARISGNWSRSAFQKSLRFYARKEYGESKMKYAFFEDLTDSKGKEIKKYDKVTLRNGGNDHILHFRDAFIHDLAKGTGIDYMASEPYILFINGEFWGMYLLREKPEDYYIQSHYGIDEAQVTVIKNGGLESGTEEAHLDYWNFCEWAATADMTKEENYKKFCEQMDVQSFMDYIAIETYVGNTDWAYGYLNNWMVWRSEVIDPQVERADGKWRFILYDLDCSSGLYGGNDTSFYYDSLGKIDAPWSDFNFPDMLRNLCKNKDFSESFYNNYLSVIDECFAIEKVEALLSEYTHKYKEATQATHHRYNNAWAADNYDKEAEGLLDFFRNRPKYAKQHLDLFCGKGITDSTILTETRQLPPSKWFYWGEATYQVDYKNEIFHAHVPKTLDNSWEAQAGASNLTLEKGCMYYISFEASCDGTGNFELFVNRNDNGDYPTVQISDFELTKELTRYDCTFVMTKDTNTDWSLCFNFGEGKGDFVLKNVSISKIN